MRKKNSNASFVVQMQHHWLLMQKTPPKYVILSQPGHSLLTSTSLFFCRVNFPIIHTNSSVLSGCSSFPVFHRFVVLLKDVCGLSKYVACQRKHKYVPSCNLLGELVIIEKLKPANCVCTKNQIAFCDVDYLSKLVASL